LLPEFKDEKAGRLDVRSAGLSLVSVLSLIYGLKHLAAYGWHVEPLLAIAAGLGIGILFVRRQKRLSDPLIDLRLFQSSVFRAALGMNMFGCFVAFGTFVFVSQYLQLVLALPPLQAGLWIMPSSLAFTVGSMLTPRLARRWSAGQVMSCGLLFCAIGFGILTQLQAGMSMAWLVTALSVYSLGLAPIFTLAADLIVSAAPPEKAGAAASLSETSTEFGGALGMAVLGSIGLAIFRTKAGFPFDGSAVLSLEAGQAFTQAMHGVAGVSAVIVLLLAVAAARLLK